MKNDFSRYDLSVTDDDEIRYVGPFHGLQRESYSTIRDIAGNKLSMKECDLLNESSLRLFMGEFNEWVHDYDVFYSSVVYLKVNVLSREKPVILEFDADEVWYFHERGNVILKGVEPYFSGDFFRIVEQRQEWGGGKKGEWRRLSFEEKRFWLRINFYFGAWSSVDKKNQILEIDGSDVLDDRDFCCAIGEAVNGPGGYFGQSLDGVDDCFFGHFGITSPVTLVWRNFESSKRAFEKRGVANKLRILFEIFENRKVRVVLA